MRGQLHTPVTLSQAKEPPPPHPLDKRQGGPQTRFGWHGEVKNFCPHRDSISDPLVVQSVASRLYRLRYHGSQVLRYGRLNVWVGNLRCWQNACQEPGDSSETRNFRQIAHLCTTRSWKLCGSEWEPHTASAVEITRTSPICQQLRAGIAQSVYRRTTGRTAGVWFPAKSTFSPSLHLQDRIWGLPSLLLDK
jgi:hypothetical protein